ncbi:MAG: plasmid mobilization relaxosome protein MobC [Acetobacter malorum]|uniref:plasmid mobilization relaxosome protein MobC n=1 Tax=Acetobacter malorum TaxID=178901 RepID=UPI0039EA58FF
MNFGCIENTSSSFLVLTSAELSGHDGRPVPKELRRICHQLSRVGNNINQLAHSANCGDAIQCGCVPDEIDMLIRQLDQILSRSRKSPSIQPAPRTCDEADITRH